MYSVKNTRYSSCTYRDSYEDGKKVKEKDADALLAEEKSRPGGGQPETEAGAEKEVKKGGRKGFPEEEAAVLYLESFQKGKEDEPGLVSQLLSQADAIKESMDKYTQGQSSQYDATMDLMAIANAEKESALKAIQVRLMFKMRIIKAGGAKSGDAQVSVNKIKKVIGKLKTKIKKLKEEAGIEKKQKNAARAKQRRMEEKLRRELEVKRTIRKKRERKDVEESRMGMGANYGGPAGSDPVSIQDFGLSGLAGDSLTDMMMGGLDPSIGAAAVAGAIADGAAAGEVCGGSIDVSL